MNDTSKYIEDRLAEMARQKMLINEARTTIQRLDVIKPIVLDPDRIAAYRRWLARFASLLPVFACVCAFALTMASAAVVAVL